ncbi:Protein of unknown function (DUF770) [Shewanella psychrophila]|uniref:Uncharacterized protein n=1 Tax=Shewanella psychrophila TaxID=225848 RepID=A0A1S6HU75_9GAMM|nr:type VI secretion system contractile sheath small subunit [Shewanella psychrophila]AQS39103.1 Protein of unknown function (DUF770) [Shewanella psychrophila]
MQGINVEKFNVNNALYVENLQVLIENWLTSISLVINRLSSEEKIAEPMEVDSDIDFDGSDSLTFSLQHFIELQQALIDLKSPKGNVNEFSKRLQEYLSSESSRNELLSEMRLIPHLQ